MERYVGEIPYRTQKSICRLYNSQSNTDILTYDTIYNAMNNEHGICILRRGKNYNIEAFSIYYIAEQSNDIRIINTNDEMPIPRRIPLSVTNTKELVVPCIIRIILYSVGTIDYPEFVNRSYTRDVGETQIVEIPSRPCEYGYSWQVIDNKASLYYFDKHVTTLKYRLAVYRDAVVCCVTSIDKFDTQLAGLANECHADKLYLPQYMVSNDYEVVYNSNCSDIGYALY